MSFAEKTSVSPERSKAEIETLVRKYGADQFVSGWGTGERRAMIGFRCKDRFVRFELAFPDQNDKRFTRVKGASWKIRTESARAEAYEQEIRRLWRALALVIKAKLEAVGSGITSFENEFMAHIVMPDGQTFAQHASPAIAQAYATGKVPLLLPAFTGAIPEDAQ